MKVNKIREGLISLDDDAWRLELGWRRQKVMCTEEALRASGRQIPGPGRPIVYDAVGEPVELGKRMTVLDKNRANRVWYVYQWNVEVDPPRFVERDVLAGSEADAIGRAETLAAEAVAADGEG